jgi:hypothetical protein
MNGKNMLEGHFGPVTQSIDAVKALLTWKGHPVSPLPADVSMDNGRLVLILSNKKDCYYVATARACSCPSATYRHNGPCKHQRKYFPVAKKSQAELEAESDAFLAAHNAGARRLARPDNIKPDMRGFRPFDTLPSEEREKAASEV